MTYVGIPYEAHRGGHGIHILRADAPAVQYLLRKCDRIRARYYAKVTWVAWCSCGEWKSFTGTRTATDVVLHQQAATWSEEHVRASQRTIRDLKWSGDRGWIAKKSSPVYAEEVIEMNGVDAVASRKEFLARRRDDIEAELARLEALPEEPRSEDEGEPEVIWFVKSFGGDYRSYTYVAVRASDGKWYTSGPKSPKGYEWADLVEWINADETDPVGIWWGSEWSPLD